MTGVSGSGKSSLAFDILFAEGQRRFLECVSAYARQFVEQLPKPDIDSLTGLPPTVAIEQRVTRGSAKSTVATVTEVAQYLRVLFARAGVLHSPTTGEPLEEMTEDAVVRLVAKKAKSLKKGSLLIAAPLVRSRKGHHRPLAEWAETKGLRLLRCDGKMLKVEGFEGLDRYSEHDVDAVFGEIRADGLISLPDETQESGEKALRTLVRQVLAAGKNACVLLGADGQQVAYLSTSRSDPPRANRSLKSTRSISLGTPLADGVPIAVGMDSKSRPSPPTKRNPSTRTPSRIALAKKSARPAKANASAPLVAR